MLPLGLELLLLVLDIKKGWGPRLRQGGGCRCMGRCQRARCMRRCQQARCVDRKGRQRVVVLGGRRRHELHVGGVGTWVLVLLGQLWGRHRGRRQLLGVVLEVRQQVVVDPRQLRTHTLLGKH